MFNPITEFRSTSKTRGDELPQATAATNGLAQRGSIDDTRGPHSGHAQLAGLPARSTPGSAAPDDTALHDPVTSEVVSRWPEEKARSTISEFAKANNVLVGSLSHYIGPYGLRPAGIQLVQASEGHEFAPITRAILLAWTANKSVSISQFALDHNVKIHQLRRFANTDHTLKDPGLHLCNFQLDFDLVDTERAPTETAFQACARASGLSVRDPDNLISQFMRHINLHWQEKYFADFDGLSVGDVERLLRHSPHGAALGSDNAGFMPAVAQAMKEWRAVYTA